MNSKVSVEKQLVNLAREDLALRRKIVHTSQKVDEQFLSKSNKITKKMKNVGNACCFETMKKMYETPARKDNLHILHTIAFNQEYLLSRNTAWCPTVFSI